MSAASDVNAAWCGTELHFQLVTCVLTYISCVLAFATKVFNSRVLWNMGPIFLVACLCVGVSLGFRPSN